jgi:hypothetical protein
MGRKSGAENIFQGPMLRPEQARMDAQVLTHQKYMAGKVV